jgi:hypothetical protein
MISHISETTCVVLGQLAFLLHTLHPRSAVSDDVSSRVRRTLHARVLRFLFLMFTKQAAPLEGSELVPD